MALQHFYSRIPARASMFNKSDSYDTFACSDGLTREFIERELSIIDDYKPTAEGDDPDTPHPAAAAVRADGC